MKILVFGAKGWIGKQFCEIVQGEHIDMVCSECRCDNQPAIFGEIVASGVL